MRKIKTNNKSYPVGRFYGFSRFKDLVDDMYSLMDTLWADYSIDTQAFEALQSKSTFPKLNVFDLKDSYKVEIALAGFSKDEINLELKDNCLFVKSNDSQEDADCKDGGQDAEIKCLLKEVSYRSFRRVIKFPEEISVDDVKCSYDNGIVTCIIDKKVVEKKSDVVKIDIA
jgi:HSP20 family molecular chaperone IbpA